MLVLHGSLLHVHVEGGSFNMMKYVLCMVHGSSCLSDAMNCCIASKLLYLQKCIYIVGAAW